MEGKFKTKNALKGKTSIPMTYFEMDIEMSDKSINPVQNKVIKKVC